eukprot:scaffold3795_cov126-Isochrysis_galbana.AAC.16
MGSRPGWAGVRGSPAIVMVAWEYGGAKPGSSFTDCLSGRAGKAHLVAEGDGVGHIGHLAPVGLVNPDLVQDGGELVAVLRLVDVGRLRAEHVDACTLQRQRKIVGNLAAN